jgi:hypothetical protein
MWGKGRGVLHTHWKRAGGDYIPVGLKISEQSFPEKKNKNPGINPGQPAGKGREKRKPWY